MRRHRAHRRTTAAATTETPRGPSPQTTGARTPPCSYGCACGASTGPMHVADKMAFEREPRFRPALPHLRLTPPAPPASLRRALRPPSLSSTSPRQLLSLSRASACTRLSWSSSARRGARCAPLARVLGLCGLEPAQSRGRRLG